MDKVALDPCMEKVEGRHFKRLDITDLVSGLVDVITANDDNFIYNETVYTVQGDKLQRRFSFFDLCQCRQLLSNLQQCFGLSNVDPDNPKEYILETTKNGNDEEWWHGDKPGEFYRWVLRCQIETLLDYGTNGEWKSKTATRELLKREGGL